MPTYITEKRGAELAREILDTIEAEERRRNGFTVDEIVDDTNAWNQGVWGNAYLDAMPAGVDVEPVSMELFGEPWHGSFVSLSGGITCGTAMCFAGHAVNMVGDRLAVPVPPHVIGNWRGKARKNFRRWFNKVRPELGEGDGECNEPTPIDKVITNDGRIMRIADRARELLGLTELEADALFAGSNALNDLRTGVRRMEEGRHVSTGRKKRAR